MNVKVLPHHPGSRRHPQDFSGARHFVACEEQAIEDIARKQLAADYQIPPSAVVISPRRSLSEPPFALRA